MLQIYKPTPKNTGAACSFTFSLTEGELFSSFIKQVSWDNEKKTGSFEGNKGKPEATVNVKFSLTEMSAVLDCLERNREFSAYHKSKNQNLSINFKPYSRESDGKQVQIGFSYQITKEVGGQKTGFLIGLTFPEGRLLREYLVSAIQCYYRKNIIDFANYRANKAQSKTQAPEPQKEPTPQEGELTNPEAEPAEPPM